MKFSTILGLSTATALCALCAPVAMAQSAADEADSSEAGSGDIIVQARKRDERAIDVPAVISAVNAEVIQDYNLRSIQDLAAHVPQMLVSSNTNGGQGLIGLRGVATGANASAGDQSVAINIDNVQVSHGIALEMGQIDLAQVEVLKGPQALFFGKNSPGGVITLRSADPTDELFTQLRLGYEFNAKGKYAEAIASGPLSDIFGLRVVGYVNDEKGAFHNDANSLIAGPIAERVGPDFTQYFGRATLTIKPSSSFDARLKASYYNKKGSGYGFGSQEFNCPGGVSAIKPSDDCKLNEHFVLADPGNYSVGVEPLFRDGKPFQNVDATMASAEMNYHAGYGTFTSVTGYFKSTQASLVGAGGSETLLAPPAPLTNPPYWARNGADTASVRSYRLLSQELRFASELDGPINFAVGAFVDDTRFVMTAAVQNRATYVPRQTAVIDSKTASAFSQFILDVAPTFQITGGGRYTWEKKQIRGVAKGDLLLPVKFAPDQLTFKNFSPEITARYKPNRDLTFYASYKQGYKSGGWDLNLLKINTSGTTTALDQSFKEEVVKGGEGGVKASLAGGSVHLDLAAYYYKYSDLQVSMQPNTNGLNFNPGVIVTNAGAATVKGVEFQGSWDTPFVQGLTLDGSLAYNSAKYTDFQPGCWRTQTLAQGCNLDNDNNGTPESQDVAGQRFERAPAWTGSLGFRLVQSLSDSMNMRLNGRLNYSDSYLSEGKLNPFSKQPSFTTIDAGVAIFAENKAWEVALIGRNLTNKIVAIRTTEETAYPTGKVGMYANVSNPRQITLQLTLRPGQLLGN